jgi:hypothetical protein
LYDIISASDQLLPISELATKKVSSVAFDDSEIREKLAKSPHLVNIAELLKTTTCAACMDEKLVVDMAPS